MFDELQKEPEDVFAQTDASAPQMSPPTMNAPSEPSVAPVPMASSAPQPSPMKSVGAGSEMGEKRPFPWKLVVLFVAIVAVVGLAFFLSMRILNSRTPVTPPAPETTTEQTETTEVETTTPAPTEEVTQVPAEDQTADADKDGLPDVREALLGTDPNSPDTDADGLFDKEEVDVYQTNPLNPDTDGDTYKDGDEVKNGYNPSGPGQLLQIPQK